ncbi:hypothetical protein A6770_40055 [Nostoc minutum NIES-26]|uniref:6-aminohexanoate hydrolase n=1 Tax=Nostoc minutum NIES-26 TaxID=1844469 RepID=A0A367RMQ2_9NOSO|nr:hypothetical protein A6770_40055 [Nostoc minutum NIES-26]
MTTEQRLDRVEDDLVVVRQLLASAATYAESANRGLEQAVRRQEATDAQIAQLLEAQKATDTKLDRLTERIDELTTYQNRTQTQLEQLSSRMNEFIFHTQRIFNQQATVLERADGRAERLEAIVQRLDRSHEQQKSQFQEFQRTTGAALERIDRVLDYLLRQQGGDVR